MTKHEDDDWGAPSGAGFEVAFGRAVSSDAWNVGGGEPSAGLGPALDATPGDSAQLDRRTQPATEGFSVIEAERYDAGGLLGRGGMGIVTATIDRRLGRVVARKQVADRAVAAPEARVRLRREAAITAQLDHPAIVAVYDAGVDGDGEPFYTMRLVAGRSLSEAVDGEAELGGRLRLLRRFFAAVEAIAYAHNKGFVHRDLKPDNILLGAFGETQVVDWGLACRFERAAGTAAGALPAAGSGAGAGAADDDDRITRLGAVVGTPAYLAPECAAGAAATPASDVFSLGVSLAEILVGRPLRRAPGPNDAEGRAAGRIGALADVAALAPAAPAELVAIVRRATASRADQRYSDAGALAVDLGAWLDGGLVGAHRYSAWEQLRRLMAAYRAPLAVAVVALAVLATVAGAAYKRTATERDRAVSAERQTLEALSRADGSLGRALLESARSAMAAELLGEAEILAAESLRLAGAPEARGILMRTRMQAPIRLGAPVPLPTHCLHRVFDAKGSAMLCLEADATSLYGLDPPALRWRKSLRAGDGALTDNAVALSSGAAPVVMLDRHDGGSHTDAHYGVGGGWVQQTPGAQALRFDVNGFTLVDVAMPQQGVVETDFRQRTLACAGRTQAAAMAPMSAHDVGASAGVAAICDSGVVELFAANGEMKRTFATAFGNAHRGATVAAWSAGGELLFIGTHDGTLGAIDVATGTTRFFVAAGVGQITTVVADASHVIVAGERGGAVVFQAATGVAIVRLPAIFGHQLALTPSGELRTFGDAMWRFRLPSQPQALRLPGGNRAHGISHVALSPSGQTVALSRADGRFFVARSDGAADEVHATICNGVAKFAAWSADGGRVNVACVRPPGLVEFRADANAAADWQRIDHRDVFALRRVIELASGVRIGVPYGHGAIIGIGRLPAERVAYNAADSATTSFLDLSVNADRRYAVAVDIAGGIHRLDDGDVVVGRHVADVPGAEVAALDAAANNAVVASPGALVVLDFADGTPRRSVNTSGGRIHDVAWSPDDRFIAVAEQSGTVRLVDAASLELRALLRGHTRRVSGLSFDDGGRWLATASWDGSALLWDMATASMPAAALVADTAARWAIDVDAVLDGGSERLVR